MKTFKDLKVGDTIYSIELVYPRTDKTTFDKIISGKIIKILPEDDDSFVFTLENGLELYISHMYSDNSCGMDPDDYLIYADEEAFRLAGVEFSDLANKIFKLLDEN